MVCVCVYPRGRNEAAFLSNIRLPGIFIAQLLLLSRSFASNATNVGDRFVNQQFFANNKVKGDNSSFARKM